MKTKFKAGDQMLTLTMQQGKRGFNVKASVKTGSGKGAPKADTGCRESFKTEAEAKSAFSKLTAEATKRGWVEQAATTTRNAFTAIPAPTAKSKTSKAA